MNRKEKIIALFDERKKVFEKKNADYGCAYIKSGELFEKIFPEGITLKTWKDHCSYQLMIRKMDKLLRYINLRFINKEIGAQVQESISDTLGDDGVYSFMLSELETTDEEKEKEIKMTSIDPEIVTLFKTHPVQYIHVKLIFDAKGEHFVSNAIQSENTLGTFDSTIHSKKKNGDSFVIDTTTQSQACEKLANECVTLKEIRRA